MHKPLIGTALYLAIACYMPREAGLVTNYKLEMDNSELVMFLKGPPTLRTMAMQARARILSLPAWGSGVGLLLLGSIILACVASLSGANLVF